MMDRQTTGRNQKSAERNSHLHDHLDYDKDSDVVQRGKHGLFNKWCWVKCIFHKKNNESVLLAHSMNKDQFPGIIDLNMKVKLKLIQENRKISSWA